MVKKRKKRDDALALAVGQRIHKAMGDMSLSELARQVDVTPNTIWSIVNGASLPGIGTLIKIVDVLNVSIDYILKGEEPGQINTKQEEDLLTTYRTIHEADPDVAEELISYGKFKLGEPIKGTKAVKKKITKKPPGKERRAYG